MNTITPSVVLIFIAFGISLAAARRSARREVLLHDLVSKWRTARRERDEWKRRNQDFYVDVMSLPEYQELWEREIGAEMLIEICFPPAAGRHGGASWREYQDEMNPAR